MKHWNYLWIAFGVFVADHLTKAIIVTRFSAETSIPVIPGFFRLVRVQNRGIAFGMFSDSASPLASTILILISAAAILMVGWLLWQNPPSAKLACAGLELILGGAAGNLLDRLMRGHVVDFLEFYVGSYRWPAFNVADSAICVGAAILLWDLLIPHPARHREA